MHDDVAYPPRTSVPEWNSTPPSLPLTAAEYSIFRLGAPDGDTATRWSQDLTDASVAHEIITVDGDALAAWLTTCDEDFERLAATKHVGWRVAAAGEEVGVLAVAAAARHVGLIEAEVTTFVASRRRALVYCPHCKAISLVDGGPGERVDCHGCRRALDVRAHLSRETGAYLGVSAQ